MKITTGATHNEWKGNPRQCWSGLILAMNTNSFGMHQGSYVLMQGLHPNMNASNWSNVSCKYIVVKAMNANNQMAVVCLKDALGWPHRTDCPLMENHSKSDHRSPMHSKILHMYCTHRTQILFKTKKTKIYHTSIVQKLQNILYHKKCIKCI